MRRAIWVVLLVGVLAGPVAAAPLNAVIGDAGWTAHVSPAASEADKIAAHLAYVEGVLRGASVAYSPGIRARREATLDRLAAYREARQFPHNTYVPGRVPVFVDADGRRCAVGALAEHDLGAATIERIAADHRLSRMPAIQDAALAAWIARSGFTLRELAMIQPEYGFVEKRLTRTTVEISAMDAALAFARRTCEDELFPGPASLPAHALEVELGTGRITWPADVEVPGAWKKCFEKATRRAWPKGLRKRTQGSPQPALPEITDAGRAEQLLQHRLERLLATCKVKPAEDLAGYVVDLGLYSDGSVAVTGTTGLSDRAARCIGKPVAKWKFPTGPDPARALHLSVEPQSAAAEVAELARWTRHELKTATD